jgi:uncharacterized protein
MAASKVYFTDLRASYKSNLLNKISALLECVDLKRMIRPKNLTAIKLHFGEKGNTAFIRPVYIRQIVNYIEALGAYPFLTDTNTLYVGTRGESVSHLKTAVENGFAFSVVNAPIVIADGLRGTSSRAVRIDKEIFKTAYIAGDILDSDILISVAHFKGHDVAGFGGSIKNIGMGCASRKGKLEQHSGLSPKVRKKRCLGCGDCVDYCAHQAIVLRDNKAFIDKEKCVGCGECIIVCPNMAINIRWNTDSALFQKKMVEYAFAVLKNKKKKAVFLNFLVQISPACDCPPFNDMPIVQDLGIMISKDPVAIDQASVDMVNQQTGLNGSCLNNNLNRGEDKFRGIYPDIDWSIQLDYAQDIGLGSRDYKLIHIEK